MNDIKKLPQEVIMKIAAGEVVERPSSIVKELVENSIDAKAKNITVEIVNGGIDYIRVCDDGIGIKSKDINTAFLRHTTSKLSYETDLYNIHTLGFRGEALASIAAISNVTLETRYFEEVQGIKINNNGGIIGNVQPSSIDKGTNIIIKDLFFNIPVRKKFLKKPATEATYITDYMLRLILSRSDISFRYINNGKTIYHSLGDGSLLNTIARVYDYSTSQKMIEINHTQNGVIIKGFIGVGDLEKSNRTHQTFFINGRYFKSEFITESIEYAAKGSVMINKYPMCVLFFTMPYNSVDVNVHPNKLEVRFANPEAIKEAIYYAIKNSINSLSVNNEFTLESGINQRANDVTINFETIKNMSIDTDCNLFDNKDVLKDGSNEFLSFSDFSSSEMNLIDPNLDKNIFNRVEENSFIKVEPKVYGDNKHDKIIENKFIDENIIEYKILGSLFNTFILIEYKDNLIIIDQHAAQERMNYERLMRSLETKTISQSYLTPVMVPLAPREIEILQGMQEDLFKAGFDVSVFDENSVVVRAVPMLFNDPMNLKECFDEIFSGFSNTNSLTQDKRIEKIIQASCKHSIKAGDELSHKSIDILIRDMLNMDIVPTCPHGRPVLIKMTKNDFYKKFKRIV